MKANVVRQGIAPPQIHSSTSSLLFVLFGCSACYHAVYYGKMDVGSVSTEINPFTPKSDQCQISPAASQETTLHSMKSLAFHSLLSWQIINYQFSLHHVYAFVFKRLGECTLWACEWTGCVRYPPAVRSRHVSPVLFLCHRSSHLFRIVINFVSNGRFFNRFRPRGVLDDPPTNAAFLLGWRGCCARRQHTGSLETGHATQG